MDIFVPDIEHFCDILLFLFCDSRASIHHTFSQRILIDASSLKAGSQSAMCMMQFFYAIVLQSNRL